MHCERVPLRAHVLHDSVLAIREREERRRRRSSLSRSCRSGGHSRGAQRNCCCTRTTGCGGGARRRSSVQRVNLLPQLSHLQYLETGNGRGADVGGLE
jgi:hypothetical protein